MTGENQFSFEDLRKLVSLDNLIQETSGDKDKYSGMPTLVKEHEKLVAKYKLYGPKTAKDLFDFVKGAVGVSVTYSQMRELEEATRSI